MPGVIAFPAKKEFCLLETGTPRRAIGVFLLSGSELHFRLRDDWTEFDDAEYLESLAEDFALKIRDMGGVNFLSWMEDTLSNYLLLSEREPAAGKSLEDLFEEHVDNRVRPFVTHLPCYSLRAAATRFGEERTVEEESWIRVDSLRLSEGMFVARVVGRSMEPLIPDGSLCVFRGPVVGSREGKRVLIEQFGVAEAEARYSVKRYTSRKVATDEGWEHQSIRLEPLNPEFETFELAGDQFRVIAEFVRVLE
jgi:phage repressor protein C with HTH and peptisase S24 domain